MLRAYCQVIYVLDRIDPADLLDVELAAAFVQLRTIHVVDAFFLTIQKAILVAVWLAFKRVQRGHTRYLTRLLLLLISSIGILNVHV